MGFCNGVGISLYITSDQSRGWTKTAIVRWGLVSPCRATRIPDTATVTFVKCCPRLPWGGHICFQCLPALQLLQEGTNQWQVKEQMRRYQMAERSTVFLRLEPSSIVSTRMNRIAVKMDVCSAQSPKFSNVESLSYNHGSCFAVSSSYTYVQLINLIPDIQPQPGGVLESVLIT